MSKTILILAIFTAASLQVAHADEADDTANQKGTCRISYVAERGGDVKYEGQTNRANCYLAAYTQGLVSKAKKITIKFEAN